MASPVYSAGTPGNLISLVSVAHGVTAAAFLDLSTSFEGQLTVETIVGRLGLDGVFTTWSVYKAYAAGSSAPITLTASAAAAATSLSTSSKTGLPRARSSASSRPVAPSSANSSRSRPSPARHRRSP